MIEIRQNDRNFEYDIYSLVKAFYPKEDVKTFIDGDGRVNDESPKLKILVTYKNNEIEIQLCDEEKKNIKNVICDFSDRKQTKNILKHLLYDMLTEYTGRQLPWGTLTGIRPTKIVLSMLEENRTKEEIYAYMKKTYKTSDEKIKLSMEIAQRELEILRDIDYKNGYSIYIGIPFCPTTCLYCSFTSYPLAIWEKKTDEYIEALFKEIDFIAKTFKNKKLNTIYMGGGTPTTLSAIQLDGILTKLEQSFDYGYLRELTVEAGRPDSITKEKFEVLKKHNVTRISINPQTMNQKTLDIIGRRHSVEQVKDAFYMARQMGFDNINMDLIVGLPDETLDDIRHTMNEITMLNPDSVTIHSLAIKRAAGLNIFKEKYKDLSINNTKEIIDLTAQYIKGIGANPYYLYRQKNIAGNFENVGYAKKGCEGIYNILIMEEKQTIIACGAGASTKVVYPDGYRIERIENVKDVTSYITRIDEMIERKHKFFEENIL